MSLLHNTIKIARLSAFACLLAISGTAVAQEIVLPYVVVDGDTIKRNKVYYRIWGIDAPEKKQHCRDENKVLFPCGAQATEIMRQWVGAGNNISCKQFRLDQYYRPIVQCWNEHGQDIGAAMLASGLAVQFKERPSKKNEALYQSYRSLVHQARDEKVGIWQDCFTYPYAWRDGERRCGE
ncbi:MAG: thermonuclease family protein [Alphaproteobacteria bacterium]|nr:thermonuclease family protein [Alphaproteobacteria bacterium]